MVKIPAILQQVIYLSPLQPDTTHLVKQNKMDIEKWKHLQVKND